MFSPLDHFVRDRDRELATGGDVAAGSPLAEHREFFGIAWKR
jgi:hypothetical protein